VHQHALYGKPSPLNVYGREIKLGYQDCWPEITGVTRQPSRYLAEFSKHAANVLSALLFNLAWSSETRAETGVSQFPEPFDQVQRTFGIDLKQLKMLNVIGSIHSCRLKFSRARCCLSRQRDPKHPILSQIKPQPIKPKIPLYSDIFHKTPRSGYTASGRTWKVPMSGSTSSLALAVPAWPVTEGSSNQYAMHPGFLYSTWGRFSFQPPFNNKTVS